MKHLARLPKERNGCCSRHVAAFFTPQLSPSWRHTSRTNMEALKLKSGVWKMIFLFKTDELYWNLRFGFSCWFECLAAHPKRHCIFRCAANRPKASSQALTSPFNKLPWWGMVVAWHQASRADFQWQQRFYILKLAGMRGKCRNHKKKPRIFLAQLPSFRLWDGRKSLHPGEAGGFRRFPTLW